MSIDQHAALQTEFVPKSTVGLSNHCGFVVNKLNR